MRREIFKKYLRTNYAQRDIHTCVHDAFTVDVDPCIMNTEAHIQNPRGRRKQYQLVTCVHDAIRS